MTGKNITKIRSLTVIKRINRTHTLLLKEKKSGICCLNYFEGFQMKETQGI